MTGREGSQRKPAARRAARLAAPRAGAVPPPGMAIPSARQSEEGT
jgi:hypothetical protein